MINFNPKLKITFYVLAWLPSYLMLSLRSQYVGSDSIRYLRFFQEIGYMSWQQVLDFNGRGEYGLYILMKLISFVSHNLVIEMLILYVFLLLPIALFFYKYSKYPFESLFIWVVIGGLSFYMTGLRQALAITVILLSIYFLIKKNYILSVLLIFLAAKCHHSSYACFIMFVFIFIRKYPNNYKILFVIIGLIFALCNKFFISYLNDLFVYEYGDEYTGNGFFRFFFISLLFMPILFYDYKKLDDTNNLLIYISYLFIIIWIGRLFDRCFERPALFFLDVYVSIIPFYCRVYNKINYLYDFILFILLIYYMYLYRNFDYTFFYEL